VRASRYLIALLLVLTASVAFAEDGRDAWLRYQPLTPALRSSLRIPIPTVVVLAGDGEVVRSAAAELARGIGGMTGHPLTVSTATSAGGAVYVGTLDRIRAIAPLASPPAALDPEAFWIGVTHPSGVAPSLVVAGGVAANQAIRTALAKLASRYSRRFSVPPAWLCTDNAAMIAWAGAERFAAGESDPLDVPARARWPLDERAEKVRGAGVKA